MTAWTCKAEPIEGLTVGQKYIVECSGDSVQWAEKELSVSIPESQKYQLKILKFEDVTNTNVKFIGVSYQAGDITLEKIILKDKSENSVVLGAWTIKVDSVIKGKPEPFGPFGPFLMSWPMWLWLALALVFLAVSSLLGRLYYLKKRKLEWARIVNQHSTALLPYHQFYKDTRKILRADEDERLRLKKLEESFRLYFLRELEVPTLEEEPKWILKHLEKRNVQMDKGLRDEFLQVFREIRRAGESQQNFASKDTEQITHHCQKIVDVVNEALRSSK
ncbi:MAG: hypothetical protein SGJ18_09540 [Pseudomonadota bacterium]|nr:hypothetical protein [Pseudomonadota bacterium]